jgi:hypothetical protein
VTAAFSDQIALLRQFLDGRVDIVDRIERGLLNVQGKETSRRRDRQHFERLLDTCFFDLPGVPRAAAGLSRQLAARHVADGFVPVALDRFVHEFDPLELIPRAYNYWDDHRWPGRSGREQYAQGLYAAFMLRQLETLSLRVWDDGHDLAEDRLGQIQDLLVAVNGAGRSAAFVRDARWLIVIAQGPLTRDLAPYFTVSEQIARSFTDSTRLGLHKAGARLAGGHLRSQLRYRSWESHRPVSDPQNLVITRNSNALDGAMLLNDLVPLLEAYGAATGTLEPAFALRASAGRPWNLGTLVDSPGDQRLDLADAILQGVSADPELFLTRLDLLTPYTMIEHLFVGKGRQGEAQYTARGERHLRTLARYRELIGALAPSLLEDAAAFDPARHMYSPQGIAYGFCADVLSNIAWDTLVSNPSFDLSLEDMFVSLGALEQKRARAKAWEALPTQAGERAHFDHSSEAAAESFALLTHALDARARAGQAPTASAGARARLFVAAESTGSPVAGTVPADVVRADEYVLTSDSGRPAAALCPKNQIQEDRNEGRFLASVESHGEWVAVSKVILTWLTSQGKDALISDVPDEAVEVLRLTCPGLLVVSESVAPPSLAPLEDAP